MDCVATVHMYLHNIAIRGRKGERERKRKREIKERERERDDSLSDTQIDVTRTPKMAITVPITLKCIIIGVEKRTNNHGNLTYKNTYRTDVIQSTKMNTCKYQPPIVIIIIVLATIQT